VGLGDFIPVVILLSAVSNGANLTDGIDGLAAGTSAISVLALGFYVRLRKYYFL
jgi:phospho-N-acetylmuramoyl-pentapeptide-transferase